MGTRTAPTWPMISLISGGGCPSCFADSRLNSLDRIFDQKSGGIERIIANINKVKWYEHTGSSKVEMR